MVVYDEDKANGEFSFFLPAYGNPFNFQFPQLLTTGHTVNEPIDVADCKFWEGTCILKDTLIGIVERIICPEDPTFRNNNPEISYMEELDIVHYRANNSLTHAWGQASATLVVNLEDDKANEVVCYIPLILTKKYEGNETIAKNPDAARIYPK